MRFIKTSFLLIIFFSAHLLAITGDEAIEKFRSRMQGVQKLTGIISWTTQSGYTYSGNFKYMAPDKIYVKFSNPQGKVLVSNGKKLWVYNSNSNICGVQDLAEGTYSAGIAGMVNGYNAIALNAPGGYTLKLKNEEKEYSEIILSVDSTFFLKKAMMKGQDGRVFSFSLSNVSLTASVMPSLFNFSVPANAQVVKNPLNIQ